MERRETKIVEQREIRADAIPSALYLVSREQNNLSLVAREEIALVSPTRSPDSP